MPTAKEEGFKVTPARLSFWLGALAVAGVLYTGVSAWNSQTYAVEDVKTTNAELKENIKDLSKSVNELAITVGSLQATIAAKQ